MSHAGLAPALALAHRADLVDEHLSLTGEGSANAHLKVPALIAGMLAGADSIDDMDLLRHGGMDCLFTGVRAPSTRTSTTTLKSATGSRPPSCPRCGGCGTFPSRPASHSR